MRYLYNMKESVKKWRDNNKDKLKLQKKREKVKSILRKYNILPEVGIPYDEKQIMIVNQITNNDFTFYENFKLEKKKQTITYKKRIHKECERPVLKKSRLLYELREVGIIPREGVDLNEEQKNIIGFVENNYETPIKSLIKKYSYLIPIEKLIWYRTKQHVYKNKNRRHSDVHFNISVEDIIIPKLCPYLGVELITDVKQHKSPFYISIDRIDSKKGYVKGNVQIISNMANRMKNNATIEQLILFSENVIKKHKGQNL